MREKKQKQMTKKVAAVAASPVCRSCRKRPGAPLSIIGQLAIAELCYVCIELRRERIKNNRAAERERLMRRLA